MLAHAAGLRESDAPATPVELLPDFDWNRVAQEDRLMRWNDERLVLG